MIATVVDDDPLTLHQVEIYLHRLGWTVYGASTFEKGRELLAVDPDLLVVDVRLGDFNGLYLAWLVREQNPAARVLVMSRHEDAVIRADSAHFGATFLAKPFSEVDLQRAIDLTRA